MTRAKYVPDAGDVVSIYLGAQDTGLGYIRQPSALVISPAIYNSRTGLMVCCPISSRVRDHPFEVVTEVYGQPWAILADQLRSVDWRARFTYKITIASNVLMAHVRYRIQSLMLIL